MPGAGGGVTPMRIPRTARDTPRGGKVPNWLLRESGSLPIGDYGIIGDCRSAALVGVDGSIDWCSLPRFDSPSIFGRLLDDKRGGYWQICPVGPYSCRQEDTAKTHILRTIFQRQSAPAQGADLLPVCDHHLTQ